METLKIVGINDDVTTCEKCGKKNLKRTVVLSDGMHEVHYGTDCAAYAVIGSKKYKDVVEKRARAVSYAKKWLGSGRTAESVQRGIFNNWGFLSEVRGNVISFQFGDYEF